jgi:hypothetical protein
VSVVPTYSEQQITTTDAGGVYHIFDLAPGTYIIEAQLGAYSKESPPFDIPEQHVANLLMQ